VDLVRPFRCRVFVTVRMDHAAGRHPGEHHPRESTDCCQSTKLATKRKIM
jgi:hypothetical protein